MQDSLAGRDVFAVLPTGGGKSLCFQLPALVRPGLTVVVSPLIALMKDQVDSLQSAGVAATYLNSSLASGESRPRLRGLHQGEFKLLYVSPERLLLPGFLEDLKKWGVSMFAVDEAHCISEWGHDFRPEYRQIANLRTLFPDVPLMALTATATERVRGDIIRQLQLKDPACYTASFNRPNLTYRVAGKSGAYEQILEFIRARKGEAGIIYVQARKTADSLAEKLSNDNIRALPYHAGLEGSERAKNQESFLRDEVRVICATIAFGMGINKPNVRYVIHYDLPKNIEGYYQETGRAGRDGLPGECLLLFSAGDRMKQMHFINEKTDLKEKEIARTQLEQMLHYAEIGSCRREFLLGYFSEKIQLTDLEHASADGKYNCEGCDNCLEPRATWDGTIAAQKFLSCVYRIRQKSGFNVGIQHVVEVLCGAESEKVRKFGHDQLSTYGIGKELPRTEWGAIGRELVRLGLLNQNTEKFSTIELSAAGGAALKNRQKITLTKPVVAARKPEHRAGEIACDEGLFDKLRALRKTLADERGLPPYIVFSDVSLRQMARLYPASEADFSRISGVGDRKLREFGSVFLAEIATYLGKNARQIFADDSFSVPAAPVRPVRGGGILSETTRETLAAFRAGRSVAQIAESRGLKEGTIYSHLEEAIICGEALDFERLVSAEAQKQITSVFERLGYSSLARVVEVFDGKYGYGECRVVRAMMQK